MGSEDKGSVQYPGDRSALQERIQLAAVAVATFVVYAETLGFGFVSDDRVQVVENPFIESWRFVPRYFASHVWSYQYPHLLSNYYRPFFLLWLRLNNLLFGSRAWGWHLTCVVGHIAVTLLLYELGRKLLRDAWSPAIAALIFGLHPVHIEAVAYVSGSPEAISALFLLGSFLAYLRAGEGRAWLWRAVSVACYGVALLTKESASALVVLIVAYDWIFASSGMAGSKSILSRVRVALAAAVPYLAFTALYLGLRFWALRGLAHVITPVPLRTVLLTVPAVLAFYVRHLIFPWNLSIYYDTTYVTRPALLDFFLPGALVVVTAAVLVLWFREARKHDISGGRLREASAIAFFAVWLAAPLIPVLNFRFLPDGLIAQDRYLYLPSIGFSFLAALALRHMEFGKWRIFGRPASQFFLIAAVGLLLGLATAYQNLYWSDELTLDFHAHQVAPNSIYATTSLGAAAEDRGLDSAAISLFMEALARRPDYWTANVNLGYLYYKQGRFADAERYFERSAASDPSDGKQFLYLGMTRIQLGRLSDAENAIRTALLVRPNGRNYHFVLGVVLEQEGNLPGAAQEFRLELGEYPQDNHTRAELAKVEALMQKSTPNPVPALRHH